MSSPRPGRHGDLRPYQPDTGAARAEEEAVQQALAEGRLALAPRATGWVEVWHDETGGLVEAPLLDITGRPVAAWDTEGLSRWMRSATQAAPARSLFARLRTLTNR